MNSFAIQELIIQNKLSQSSVLNRTAAGRSKEQPNATAYNGTDGREVSYMR